MKKLYVISFPGVYLTGYCLVVAASEDEAIDLALKGPILNSGLQPLRQDVEITKSFELNQDIAYTIWDGDY